MDSITAVEVVYSVVTVAILKVVVVDTLPKSRGEKIYYDLDGAKNLALAKI